MNAAVKELQLFENGMRRVSVIQCLDQGRILTADGAVSLQAASCLVVPCEGDDVLVWFDGTEHFVLHILSSSNAGEVAIGHDDKDYNFKARHFSLAATGDLKLLALKSLSMLSVNEMLLKTRHLTTHVVGSWIQNVATNICNYVNWTATTKQFTRFHSQRKYITAEKELKIDADLIQMG